MTTEDLKQDFDSARIKHVHFKSKLRSFLFGNGGSEDLLRDPEQCGLGLWIATRMRGTGVYAHLPEARHFDQQHVLIHREASRLMDLYLAGNVQEAGAGYAPLQVIADEMMGLLQTMETKLRTKA
ncbi:CZB domain-containing protein [Hymenobacter negativus]|uniref:CZB domain-containing protein n=1 Tax=Hymenobacter negativus TaxID=2795026 RepID=A0ABS0Q6R5_9BACT|nr:MULTISPECIES: CZB domain-containing protein [Bacteria]MBH8558315.1 CZB domain-containing protein [Hymenobacter negativus]MBH8568805.1 CZB domain-containing protein [Hymenobacter negativus]MBR7208539.1 CZB domain-containing protein [Microvirga sp. STS02]